MEVPAALNRAASRIGPSGRDRLAALLLVSIAVVEVLVADLAGPVAAVLVQSVVITAATAWRRSAPLAALTVAALAGAANPLIYSGSAFDFVVTQVWAVVLLSYSVAAYEERTESAVAGALLLLATYWVDDLRQGSPPGEYLASLVGVAAAWAAGRAVAGARRQARQLREANEELARQRRRADKAAADAERLRIARDLHDILAHSLTVVAVQADAADALLPAHPERAQRAVVSIRTTAQEALGEMRRLLGVLRPEPEGRPDPTARGMADVDALIAEAGGPAVCLRVEGNRHGLTGTVDRTAYRILQEALTNARRHGDGTGCRVTVRYTADTLELTVWNTAAPAPDRGTGYGLIGVRERVQAVGGELTAGPEEPGAWRLSARLPIGVPAR